MIRLLVAMEREGEALAIPFEFIGIGADSVPSIAPDDIIVNVGYCGGDGIAPGTIVEPQAVVDAETGEWLDLSLHFGNVEGVVPALCITSPTFITTPLMTGPAVYDMELAKLARIPCKALYTLKIVSDDLNEAACEAFSDADAWSKVRELLVSAGLIQLSATQR
jgi:hypothetical protein